MKHFKILPWLLFPLFIISIILLRNGTLLTIGFDFNIIHNICGISTLTHLGLTTQDIMVNTIAFRVGLIFVLLTILFGPFFCGYVCPFGVYQRILFILGKNLNLKFKLPKFIRRILTSIKYVFLALFIYYIVIGQVIIFINLEPYHAFIRLFYGGITFFGGSFLIIITVFSLFINRPYCTYFCAYGAGFNLLGSLRALRVTRDKSHCIDCKKCDKVCSATIDISTKEHVNALQCISCHDCIQACPKPGALTLKSHNLYFVFFFVAVFLSITFILLYQPHTIEQQLPDIVLLEDAIIPPEDKSVIEVPLPPSKYHWTDVSLIRETIQADLDYLSAIKLAEAEELERIETERLRIEAEAKAAAEAKAEAKAEAEAKAAAKAEADAEAAAENHIANTKYNNGIFKATVNAYRAGMVVQIEIKNDVILSVEVIQHQETRSYFNFSAPKMYKQIVESNSTDVNVISGATYTSLGIRNGVKACLNKAKK